MTTITNRREGRTREQVGTAQQLRDALGRVDAEGWDREAGRVVLEYAMRKVVRPVVRTVGFTGAEAEYAESTGWAAA